MQSVSSAVPTALGQYARAAEAAAARLAAEGRHLDAALAAFQQRCVEERVVAAAGLDLRLAAAARGLGELGLWVEGVAADFRAADSAPARPISLSGVALGRRPAPDGGRATVVPAPVIAATVALLLGKPEKALLTMMTPRMRETLAGAGWLLGFVVGELTGLGELDRSTRALRASMRQSLEVIGAALDRHGYDAATVLGLSWIHAHTRGVPGLALLFDEGTQQALHTAFATPLHLMLGAAEGAAGTGPLAPALAIPFAIALGPPLVVCGLSVLALSVLGDAQHWAFQPVSELDDVTDLAQRSVWNQVFDAVSPQLRRQLGARLDALNLLLHRPGPPEPCEPPAPPASDIAGAYKAISYADGEQVVLERLNGAGDYRLSIAGLDPKAPGAPNNFEAVMLTADFPREENHYYEHVRARVLTALEQLPPGSELHLQGHSMGGGMCLLLRDDPEVIRRLREAQVTVPSLTIYGAVVPHHAWLGPPRSADDPFADAKLQAFVHASDSLALNVGSGYGRLPDARLIGGATIDAPEHAHGDYGAPEHYSALPAELRALPYVIDAAHYERTIPVAPAPAPPPAPAAATPLPPDAGDLVIAFA